MGSPKASVFPDPVFALPQMSRPASTSGIVRAWIGKGESMPSAASAATRSGETPSVSNVAKLLLRCRRRVRFGSSTKATAPTEVDDSRTLGPWPDQDPDHAPSMILRRRANPCLRDRTAREGRTLLFVPRLDHTNLGVPVDGLHAEAALLVDLLGD